MRTAIRRCILSGLLLAILPVLLVATEVSLDSAQIMIWAQRNYNSWDNPLETELSVNGNLVNIFSSDTFEPIEKYLKNGWNDLTLITRPQVPAGKDNELIFRVGPMQADPKDAKRMVMAPVLWEFRNGTDWSFNNGLYSYPLGPNVKEVTLSYQLYYAGLDLENQQLNAGDFVLQGKPNYTSWNSPVTATVFVNGTPLNSFTLHPRQVVITKLLRPGKNEIKLISRRVKNAIKDNDILFTVGGPAEWNVSRKQYLFKPIVEFKARQGWQQDAATGQLINPAAPDSETIERVISFVLKE